MGRRSDMMSPNVIYTNDVGYFLIPFCSAMTAEFNCGGCEAVRQQRVRALVEKGRFAPTPPHAGRRAARITHLLELFLVRLEVLALQRLHFISVVRALEYLLLRLGQHLLPSRVRRRLLPRDLLRLLFRPQHHCTTVTKAAW